MSASLELYCQGKRIKIRADQLIKRGGEGAVYRHEGRAIKIYDQPLPDRIKRLRRWLERMQKQPLPPQFIVPEALVTDKTGQVTGFTMPLLPSGAIPLKALCQPNGAAQAGWQLRDAAALLPRLWADLQLLHRQGIVVGDLSDQNVHIDLTSTPPAIYWIDSDSYQFETFACQVMQPTFAAPWINCSSRPQFTPASDRYAFHVLLCKLLLWVHPYGGVHKQWKTLLDRQQHGSWVLDPEVTYPRLARPAGLLTPELQAHLARCFTRPNLLATDWPDLPESLLRNYNVNLADCAQCGTTFPRSAGTCPNCQQQLAQRQIRPSQGIRWLLPPGDYQAIHTLQIQPETGRLQLICYRDGEYFLLNGGVGGRLQPLALFRGEPGYRFGLFGRHLLVEPPTACRQLIFDVSGDRPRLLERLTVPDQNQNVWAATRQALYRRAGDYLNRGRETQGYFVEEIAFPIRPSQLQLWPSPWRDQLVGREQQFRETCYFVWQRDELTGQTRYFQLDNAAFGTGREEAVLQSAEDILLVERCQQGQGSLLNLGQFDGTGRLLNHWQQPLPLTAQPAPLAHGCWHAGRLWLPGPNEIRQLSPNGDVTTTLPE
ncbi:MAG: hypothetical protein KDE04_18730, partial [Anaerolineales bacterium]|nr:hypothetical protein [Anaerolineales bacterium]